MGKNRRSVTSILQDKILSGEFAPGARLAEIPTSESLGVSRTPVRIAFRALEQQGLLIKLPGRGYRVRDISHEEINSAMEVRAVLEGLAARLAAEKGLSLGLSQGLSERERSKLNQCLAQGDEILAEGDKLTAEGDSLPAKEANLPAKEADLPAKEVNLPAKEVNLPAKGFASQQLLHRFVEIKAAFHQCIVEASGNAAIANALKLQEHLPLVSIRTMAYNEAQPEQEFRRLQLMHQQHHAIAKALFTRQGEYAEALMKEYILEAIQHFERNKIAAKLQWIQTAAT